MKYVKVGVSGISSKEVDNLPEVGEKILVVNYDTEMYRDDVLTAVVEEGIVKRIRATKKLVIDVNGSPRAADYLREDGIWGYEEEEKEWR